MLMDWCHLVRIKRFVYRNIYWVTSSIRLEQLGAIIRALLLSLMRGGGQMVCALDPGLRGLGSSPTRGTL